MNLENIMLDEISLTQKDKYSIYSDSTYMRCLEGAKLPRAGGNGRMGLLFNGCRVSVMG